ncbi:MAG: hypothetical protein H8E34_05665 [Bacteroidetes bacterium]|nr:hypothetical protein [Bacteroidota bacterium]MBL6944693.1 hypothetical protein [Bacteroidales bacterium]
MNKKLIGLILGALAGVIDVIPMIIQNLSWDANISAFTMWVVIGFFIGSVVLKINSFLKGILISLLVLLPSSIIIGWHGPSTLIPIVTTTVVLGGLLGYSVNKLTKK